jgi:hypothetical protein
MTSLTAPRPGVPARPAAPPHRLALLALANTGVFVAIGVVTPAFFFAAGLLGAAPVAVLVVVAAPILGVVALGFVDRAILQQGGDRAAARALGGGLISLGASGVSMATSVLSSPDGQRDLTSLVTAWMLALVPGSIGTIAATLLVGGRRVPAVVGALIVVLLAALLIVRAVAPDGRELTPAELASRQQAFGSSVRPWVADIPGYHRLWAEAARDGDVATVVVHYRADDRADDLPVETDDILITTRRLDGTRADEAFCAAPLRLEQIDQTPLVTDPTAAACEVSTAAFSRATPEAQEVGRAAPDGLLVTAAARSEVALGLLDQAIWNAHVIDGRDYAAVLVGDETPRDGLSDYPPGSVHG